MHQKLGILVIEDQADIAHTLCRLITRKIPFAECRIAHTFHEGLTKANEDRADLTLLDIHLPDADIDEVITSIPKFPRPVIVVTEMDDPDNLLMDYCYAYNAENFFEKRNLIKIVSTWDAEMTSRQLVSSIASAHFRNVMPTRRKLFEGGLKHLFTATIQKLDAQAQNGNGNGNGHAATGT